MKERFCSDCVHYNAGHCTLDDSPFYGKPMDPEDSCEDLEPFDTGEDEPQDLAERRCEDD